MQGGLDHVEQIIVNGSFEKVLEDIYKIVEEDNSDVTYDNPAKGIMIVERSKWAWDAIVIRIIDVTPVPGGCQVNVTSFMPPSAMQFHRRMKAAELRIIDGLKRRMASTEIPPLEG